MPRFSWLDHSSPHLVHFKKIVKELAAIDHRFAKILGAGFPSLLALCNVTRRTVVFDYSAIIDRDVSHALFDIPDWIATRFHDLSYQPIGLHDGALGIMDESGLIGMPRLGKPIALMRLERANSELLSPLLAPYEFLFSAALAALLSEQLVVFRSELRAKMLGPPLAEHPPSHNRGCNNHRDHYNDCPTWHISSLSERCMQFGFLEICRPTDRLPEGAAQ